MDKRKALYVVSHDYTSLTKVGASKSLQSRIQAIKHSIGAELRVYYESPLMDNWREIELEVIRQFKTKETFGEWVLETPQKIIEYIKTIEHKFNNAEYYFQESKLEKTAEKIEQVKSPFYYQNFNNVNVDRNLILVSNGVYRDDKYLFYVSYHIGENIVTVCFNVLSTAESFSKSLGLRLVLLDLDNKEFISNPKFKVNGK